MLRSVHTSGRARIRDTAAMNVSVMIPIPVIVPLALMSVVPRVVLVPAFLSRIGRIAATLLGLPAALNVFANSIVELGFSFLHVPLAFGSILGVSWQHSQGTDQNGQERCG